MAKKYFNPADWMRTDALHTSPTPSNPDLEIIISRIESAALDIAPGYADWRDLGFALADAFGENGRSYYHRLSRFYPNYKRSETDKQFSACLKSHGHGITIKTLYHLAKSAGIDISTFEISKSPILPYCQNGDMAILAKQAGKEISKSPKAIQGERIDRILSDYAKPRPTFEISKLPKVVQGERRDKTRFDYAEPPPTFDKLSNCQNGNLAILAKSEEKVSETLQPDEEQETLPTLPESIFPLLPNFLRQITDYANSREDADLLLLGSLVVTSACFPNVYGIYGGVTVFPNLFLFVSAQASAGKGRLSLCRRLVEPIHRQLREINKLETDEYKQQQKEYAANKKNPDFEQPQEPPLRILFIPANSSATAVFQILNDNAGVGLMFETEGDTLAQTFKSEHGNYSDGFRKAFHHEKISYLRRKDREYVTLENPKLSVLLSGTPRQVQSLIPDSENGLFSRFIFYCMNIRLQWIDVFACNENESLDQRFNRFGDQFFDFYRILKQYENIRFSLSPHQQTAFNHYFEQIQQQYWELLGSDYVGTIRRLGLITFRIAMILTILRTMDDGFIAEVLEASDVDFQIAMEIVKVLLQHASYVFRQLPSATPTPTNNPKMALFQALPTQFDRAKYIEIAAQLQIPDSTADKQIARFLNAGLLIKLSHGSYAKKES